MSQFATANELATLLRRTFSSAETAAANLALQLATGAIKRHTGQQIELVTDDVADLVGTWKPELALPQWPVISVISVKWNDTVVPTGTWVLAGRTLYRGPYLPIFNGPDDWGGDLLVSAWFGPVATITVKYTHGFATIPDDIKGICLQAAARAFFNPQGLASETAGSYSYSVGSEAQGAGLLTQAEKDELDRIMPTL